MEPALAQFESKYKSKINLVSVNVDDTASPEAAKYLDLLKKNSDSIPYTMWIDAGGKTLAKNGGVMSEGELEAASDGALKLQK